MTNENDNTLTKAVQAVSIHRILSDAREAQEVDDLVAVEQPVSIVIDEVGTFTVLCTPTDLEALAVGFVFTEGMVDTLDDVVCVAVSKRDPSVVGVKVEEPGRITSGRNLIIASSCGLCGARNVTQTLAELSVPTRLLQVSVDTLMEVMARLQSVQEVFRKTGGTHAAGVFDSDGRILSFAEDLGRHNAMDKAIGKCLLDGLSTAGCGVALSGRASFEMVSKAARAGLELIASVSAPSSLAIKGAERAGITLCGFVRSGRVNVYTHQARIGNQSRPENAPDKKI